jgi:hypothetical protein
MPKILLSIFACTLAIPAVGFYIENAREKKMSQSELETWKRAIEERRLDEIKELSRQIGAEILRVYERARERSAAIAFRAELAGRN